MVSELQDMQENAETTPVECPCSAKDDAYLRSGVDLEGAIQAETATNLADEKYAKQDAAFMALALEQAHQAAILDEAPIGAVVVYEGQVIAQACNRREVDADPAGHAEFLAMKQAAERLGVWRLSGCTVYVTLEPCLMCAGLMYQARIDRCVYGAADPKAGALGTLYQVNADERLNHTFEVTSGVREEECAEVLRTFFREKRARNKERKQAEKGNS